MPPKTRRAGVPEAEWERYKEDIKNLYLIDDLTLKAVADEMRGRLDASPAQFETHLKAWGIRKNLAAQEWKLIFDTIDKLPRNTETKVIISGQEASATKIQRAKRNYQKSPSGVSKRRRLRDDSGGDGVQALSDLQDVLVQVQENGIWTTLPATLHNESIENRVSHHALNASNTISNRNEQYTLSLQHNAELLPQLETNANSELLGEIALNLNSGLESRNLETEEAVLCENDDIAQGNTAILFTSSDYHNGAMITSPHAGNSNYIMNASIPSIGNAIEELVTSMENVAEVSLSDPISSFGLELSVQETNNSSLEWEQYAFPSTDAALTGLPMSYVTPRQYMGDVEMQFQLSEQDIPFDMSRTTTQLRIAYCHSSISLSTSSIVLPSTEIIDQSIEVCRNVITPDPSLPWHLCTYIHAKHKSVITCSTPALVNLFSARVFVGERRSQFEKLPSNIAFEARIHTRLLVAMINGLPGLKNISSVGLLRFLQRHQAIQVLIASLLHSCSNPTGMSLAENIFQAALEADDVVIVKNLLDHTTFIDLNKTVCHHKGERYTPVEIAARYQSLDILEHLLNRDVEINRSYDRYRHLNALEMLIEYNTGNKSTLSDRFLGLVDTLLTANNVSMAFIQKVLAMYTDPRLAIILIEKPASKTPLELIADNNLLEHVLKYLQEQDATNLITLIVKNCQNSVVNICFHEHIHDLLCKAILRGYEQLVEIIFPHTTPPNKAFQKSKETRNQTMINLTLQKDTSLNKDMDIVNDFIVALRTKNQDSLHSFEAKGILNSLARGSDEWFREAYEAAVTTGNSEYAAKIHSVFVATSSTHGEFALCDIIKTALSHNFDYIAEDLLPMMFWHSEQLNWVLCVAIERRKHGLVKAILNHGVDPNKLYSQENIDSADKGWIVLEAAIECGDSSIFNDVWQAHSHPIYPTASLLTLALQNGPPNLFWDILAPAKFTATWAPPNLWQKDWSTAALSAVINHENLPLFDKLIHFGVKLEDDGILLYAIDEHPLMVEPLLQRYQKAYPDGIPGYGRIAIMEAIFDYPESSHWLSMFFKFKLVTQHILRGHGDKHFDTPLCEAIMNRNPISMISTGKRERGLRNGFGVMMSHREHRKPPNMSLVQMLLDAHGPGDINSTMRSRYDRSYGGYARKTVLLEAIDMENIEIIDLLIRHHANVNEPALYGVKRTPLQKAAEQDHHELVSLLLRNGADPNAEPATFDGATPLQFAAIKGNIEIAETLIKNGARLDVPPPRGLLGRWPLEGAAEHGRLDMIQFLWEVNGHPFDDQICKKAIQLAEHKGHFGCKMLIEQLMANPPRTDFPTLGA